MGFTHDPTVVYQASLKTAGRSAKKRVKLEEPEVSEPFKREEPEAKRVELEQLRHQNVKRTNFFNGDLYLPRVSPSSPPLVSSLGASSVSLVFATGLHLTCAGGFFASLNPPRPHTSGVAKVNA